MWEVDTVSRKPSERNVNEVLMVKTEYTIYAQSSVTLAVVADLHERRPQEVVTILTSVHPDFILVPGDLFENHRYGENLDKHDDNAFSRFVCRIIHGIDYFIEDHPRLFKRKRTEAERENAYEFLREANKIAPVYMSVGNHELYFTEDNMAVIKETGTVLLDNEYKVGKDIVFGGLTSKCVTGEFDTEFLSQFSSTPSFKILLCHHPEYYPQIKHYPIDLIVSGHAHGGQVRMFGRGVFSPGQGLWPKYTKGVYDERLVVSAGCSNTAAVPRINNPTEVVIVKVEKGNNAV